MTDAGGDREKVEAARVLIGLGWSERRAAGVVGMNRATLHARLSAGNPPPRVEPEPDDTPSDGERFGSPDTEPAERPNSGQASGGDDRLAGARPAEPGPNNGGGINRAEPFPAGIPVDGATPQTLTPPPTILSGDIGPLRPEPPTGGSPDSLILASGDSDLVAPADMARWLDEIARHSEELRAKIGQLEAEQKDHATRIEGVEDRSVRNGAALSAAETMILGIGAGDEDARQRTEEIHRGLGELRARVDSETRQFRGWANEHVEADRSHFDLTQKQGAELVALHRSVSGYKDQVHEWSLGIEGQVKRLLENRHIQRLLERG